MRQVWQIVDKRSGQPVSVAGCFSELSANQLIESWRQRQARGIRPDVTIEMLDNMEPRLVELP